MKHKCVIIGGGLAGLTAGIRCAQAGIKAAVVTSGECSLAFASGAVDVLGYLPHSNGGEPQPVRRPFDAIDELISENPNHPYARVGSRYVFKSMDWFHGQLTEAGLTLGVAEDCRENQWRVTAAGALRPTWLSQPSTPALPWDFHGVKRVVFVNVTGFLDFMPELAAAGLKRHPAFANVAVEHLNISLPLLFGNGATADTMRAPQLARAIGPRDMEILASTLIEKVPHAELVVLPACLDTGMTSERLDELRQRTGLNIIDVATLPPSVLGMRIHNALRRRFIELGGFLVPATQASLGLIDRGFVQSVNAGEDLLSADHFILATGSFFSKGLSSVRDLSEQDPFKHLVPVKESVFGLDINNPESFSGSKFLSQAGHGFVRAGVTLDNDHHPLVNDEPVTNLYAAGAVLGGYDPVQECSGGGVAISTAWKAAECVIAQVKADEGVEK